MLIDTERAAKRIEGFLKTYPNPKTSTIKRWLDVICQDELTQIDLYYKNRFDGFTSKDKSFLKKYESDLLERFECAEESEAILVDLKNVYFGQKYFPNLSVIRRFRRRSEVWNG